MGSRKSLQSDEQNKEKEETELKVRHNVTFQALFWTSAHCDVKKGNADSSQVSASPLVTSCFHTQIDPRTKIRASKWARNPSTTIFLLQAVHRVLNILFPGLIYFYICKSAAALGFHGQWLKKQKKNNYHGLSIFKKPLYPTWNVAPLNPTFSRMCVYMCR